MICLDKSFSDVFMKNEYKLLCLLTELKSTTAEGEVIQNSQEDIAKQFRQSLATTNKLMQNLCTAGCIEKIGQRKGYLITVQGETVFKQIENIDRQFKNKPKRGEKR